MEDINVDEITVEQYDPVDITEYKIDSYQPSLPEVDTPESKGVQEDTETDYKNARKTYYELIERGKDALEGILQVASSAESPRAYEVAAQLIKTISESNDKIVLLQEQMRKIQEQEQKIERNERLLNGEESGAKNVTNNAIFVGSMNEFQQMLKKMKSGELQEPTGRNDETEDE